MAVITNTSLKIAFFSNNSSQFPSNMINHIYHDLEMAVSKKD